MVILGAFAQHLMTTWEGFEASASDDDSDVEDSDRSEGNDSSDANDGDHDDEGSDIVVDNNTSAEETYYSNEGESKSRSESESFSRQDDRSSSNDSRRTDTSRSVHSGEASTAASRSGHSGEGGLVDFRSVYSGEGDTTGSQSVYSGEGSTAGGRSVYSGEASSAGGRSVYSGEASSAGSRSVYSGEASSAGSRSVYSGEASSAGSRSMYSSSEASSGDSTRSRSYGSEDDSTYYSGSAAVRSYQPSNKSRTPKSTVSMDQPLLEAKEKTDQGYESSDTDSTKSHDHETQLLVVLEDREDIVGSASSNTDTTNDDDQPFDSSSETDAGRSYRETKTSGSPAEMSEYPISPSVSHTIASPSLDTPQSNPERKLSMEATLSIFSASSNASSRPASSRSQRRHPSITENVHTDYQRAGEASIGLVDVFGASRLGIQESSMGLEDVFGSPPANEKHPGSDGSHASPASEISRESMRLSKPDCSSDSKLLEEDILKTTPLHVFDTKEDCIADVALYSSKHSATSDASRLPKGPVGDSAFGGDSLVDGDVVTSNSSKGAFEGAFGTELLDSTGDQRDESSSPCSTTSTNTSNGQPDVSSPRGSSGHSRDTSTARQLEESSHLRPPSNSRRNISGPSEASSGHQRSSHSMDTTVRSEGSTTISHGGPSGHSRDTASSSGRAEESGNLRPSTPSMDTGTIVQSESSRHWDPAGNDIGRSDESIRHRSSHPEASSHQLPTTHSRPTISGLSDGSSSRQSSAAPSSLSRRPEEESFTVKQRTTTQSRFPVPSSDRSDKSKRRRSSANSKDERSRGSEVLSHQRPSTHSRESRSTRGEEPGQLLPLSGSTWQANSGWSEESSQSVKGNRASFAKRDESWKNGSSRPSHREQSPRLNTAHSQSARSGRRSGDDKGSRTDGRLEGANPATGSPRRTKRRPTEATSTGRNSRSSIDVSSTSRSLDKSTSDYDFDPDRPVSSIEAKPSSMMSSQYSGESPRSLPKPVTPNEILGFLNSLSSSGDPGGKKFESPEKKKVARSAKSRASGKHHPAGTTSKQPTRKTSMKKSTPSEIALEDAGLVSSASQDHATPATNTPVASTPMAYLSAPHALFHGLRDTPLLDTQLPTSGTLIDPPVTPVETMSAPLLDQPSLDVEYSPSHASALSSWPGQPPELEPVSPLPSRQHIGINEAAHQSIVLPVSRPLAVLRNMHVPFRSNLTNIYCSIQNEGYLEAVEKSYLFLLELRPRLRYLFSMSEWIHIHALMLYARVFDCELAASGMTLPPPPQFRIDLPRHLSVLEPLAVVLESIGIVEDRAKGVRYIPVAKPRVFGEEGQVRQKGKQGDNGNNLGIVYNNINQTKPYVRPDPEDVTEFLEWTQYPWTQSWIKVEQAREARQVMALADGIKVPTKSFAVNHAKLLEWEHLALEKWLGWDEALWFAYDQAVQIFQNQLSFVPFPNQSPWGTYSWLLARHVVREATYNTNRGNDAVAMCRLPNPGLPPEVWMIGLLFNFSGVPLEDQIRLEWYYETVPTNGIPDRLLVFLASAVISKPLTGL